MAQMDQLEVVSPSGDITFFDLDVGDGLTNVGRHPSNNVVLRGPNVADFHLVIDHRSKPYQVAVIDPGAQATVAGQPLTPGVYLPLQPWDSIDLAGYAMILVEGQGEPAYTPPAPSAAVPLPAATPPATTPPVTPPPGAAAPTVGPGGAPAPTPATPPVPEAAAAAPGAICAGRDRCAAGGSYRQRRRASPCAGDG